MKDLIGILTQPFSRTIALALIHFLWQGTLVALLLSAANLALRRGSARARYGTACAALIAMLLLPAATAWRIEHTRVGPVSGSSVAPVSAVPAGAAQAPSPLRAARTDRLAALAPWIVLVWLVGVCLLSIRFLGGCLAAQRLKHRHTRSPGAVWEERLSRLAARLRVARPVRLLESARVAVPTAVGILRPVILLPAGIATGMSPDQLDSLLAHELAHIRRSDCLMNLFQALAETLLFYHPAVWWVSARIRDERENACDDLAVGVTGNPTAFARALLELAQRREAAPGLAMAADGGQLWKRITRLIPSSEVSTSRSTRWLAAAVALGGVLALGAAAQVPVADSGDRVETAAAQEPPPASAATGSGTSESAPRPDAAREKVPESARTRAPGSPALLSPEQLIAFRIHGVTPEFIGEIVALGYAKASPAQLVALRIHGVTPEYIRSMTAIFGKLPLEKYTEFRIHGLSPDSLRQLEKIFGKLSADDAMSMRIHGVTPEFAGAMRAQGLSDLTPDDLVAFRIHGVTPEFVRDIRALGYASLSADDFTAFRIHGVSAKSIEAMNRKFGQKLSADDLVDGRIRERRAPESEEEEP